MSAAIKISDLSKQYRLGQVGTGTISHDLNRWWANVRGKDDPYSTVGAVNKRDQAAESEYVWALKDINLDVQQGEVLGIIGANGAGKSTLLKLISRITSPTTGSIKAKGRIASLLEVGTGMHPEMTARENIYLNGSILGMRRHEITRKLDEIVDFSGCEMYLDTPTKRFSSGMTVRLAFSVAAFLEPETLIVDEVLAVGDAAFQAKCVGKLEDVAGAGRTVLFVSHNMAAVQNLCTRGILLAHGGIVHNGGVGDAVQQYLAQSHLLESRVDLTQIASRRGTGQARLTAVEFLSGDDKPATTVEMDKCLKIRLNYETHQEFDGLEFGVVVTNPYAQRVFRLTTRESSLHRFTNPGKSGAATVTIPNMQLVPGTYSVTLGLSNPTGESLDYLADVANFTVTEADVYGTGRFPSSKGGIYYSKCHWEFR